MANSNTPFGLRPVSQLDGSPYNGAARRCVIAVGDGTATFIGDPVKLAGSSVNGYPTVIQAGAGDEIFGVVTGFELDPTNLANQYRLASTQRFCFVVPALDVLFEVQANGVLTAGSVGEMAPIIVGAGVTSTGISGVQYNASSSGSSAAALHLLQFVDSPDNDLTLTNAKLIVRINQSSLRGDGTGI